MLRSSASSLVVLGAILLAIFFNVEEGFTAPIRTGTISDYQVGPSTTVTPSVAGQVVLSPTTSGTLITSTTANPMVSLEELRQLASDNAQLRAEIERLIDAIETVPGRLRPSSGQVALTFDDGPEPAYTRQVLKILDDHDVKATFFVIGRSVKRWPDLTKEIHDRGHSVQNHTWDHPDLRRLGDGAVLDQLSRTNDEITLAIGETPGCFRPPFGGSDKGVRAAAESLGLQQILWTDDSRDYQRPSSELIVERLTDTDGERPMIALLHDGGGTRTKTVEALPDVIETLQEHGYIFVTLC